MAIWNGTHTDDLVTGLLSAAFPQVNETAELMKHSPDELRDLELKCAEADELVATQVNALADLLCHANQDELAPGTVNAIGWALKALQSQRDIAARIATLAGYAADTDIRRAAGSAEHSPTAARSASHAAPAN